MVVLGLLVLLFVAAFWVRPDDRLRCWIGGWLFVLVHFATELFHSSNPLWSTVLDSAGLATLAMAGIFFVVSTMILREGRRAGFRLALLLAAPTLACLILADIGFHRFWPFVFVIVARQGVAIFLAARRRSNRRQVASLVVCICLLAGACMLFGVATGQPDLVIVPLLSEIFVVCAIEFWNNGWPRSLALKTMGCGLVAWAVVFPAGFLVDHVWPAFVVKPGIWNTPKWCVAVGMILMVLEEETRTAHRLLEEYRLLFDTNPQPLWVFETETFQFLRVNQAALDKHGYTREEFLRFKVTDILDPESKLLALHDWASAEPVLGLLSRHIRKDGSVLSMDITAYNIVFQGKPGRFVQAVDVSEREKLELQLVSQAKHDPLTGLPNRLAFQERLTETVRESIAAGERLAILCIDIRRFKRINDTYGPQIGDECIQRVASLLGARLGPADSVARTAGEEFAMVLTGIKSAASVEQAVNDLREALVQPFMAQGYKIQLSFSFGLAVCPDDGIGAMALWRGAESALRQAQAGGGGQTAWLSPELNSAAEEQIELEKYMRQQLEAGGFFLAYQPFYDFDGAVQGLEALLRLNHPQLGAVSPARFIPIAEEMGLIRPLGAWVLDQVCRQIGVWEKLGMRLVPVAVNVSGLQLMHSSFAARVMETLERHGVDPRWIHLEVTESVAMRNPALVAERMVALSSRGIAFSMDDFGTGYSSLGRIHQLPLSVLKIDQSFIAQLCVHNGTYSIVQAIISMAHALGHQVVAEGVETEGQLGRLQRLHCDLMQGFLLSRPVPPAQIPALVGDGLPAFRQHRGNPLLPPQEDTAFVALP